MNAPRTAVAIAATALLVSTSARADEPEAERLFREGRAMMLDGNFDEACPKIAESQRLDPHVGTLLNLAACHERQGKVASAWVEYQKALTAARTEGQSDRARLAEQRIAAIEPRVPWLRISVRSGGSDLVVSLDGSDLAPVALGAEMPVDPGAHAVGARASDRRPSEERIDLREGERRTVAIDLDERLPPLADPATPERVVVEPKASKSTEPEKNRWIIELGVYVGFLGGHLKNGSPRAGSDAVGLYETTTSKLATCSVGGCDFDSTSAGTGSLGVNLFAGYALSENFRAGLRLLGGPSFSDGSVIAAGPSIGIRAASNFDVGVWAMLGDAALSGNATVVAPPNYSVRDSTAHVEGDLGGGGGLGVEASLRVMRLTRGDLVINSTPFFLFGSQGNAFTLPIGLAYRFQ